MPTEKRVPSLIVNTLTEAQYQALENPSDTEMWVTPYDESILPDQTGQSGKFLTTDGTDASWAAVDTLPSQSGQSGKFLTTDGTDASWATISSSVPTLHYIANQTGTSITIPDTSSARLVKVYKNGILLDRLSDNYSISGTTLTISPALELADTITLEVY